MEEEEKDTSREQAALGKGEGGWGELLSVCSNLVNTLSCDDTNHHVGEPLEHMWEN